MAAVFLSRTEGMCRTCRTIVPARYHARDGHVFLDRYCPEHGTLSVLVADSLSWFLSAQAEDTRATPPSKVLPERKGSCPRACGPCAFHGQTCRLPIISITNACNLRCPICFGFNKDGDNFFLSPEDFGRQLDFLVDATGGVDVLDITGGEPTLHPRLFDLLELTRRPGIGRVTVNSNGLALAKNPDIAMRLSDLGAYVVLSLDTLQADRSLRLHGRDIVAEKRKALEHLEKYNVQTTLLHVLVPGLNEDEMGSWLDLLFHKSFVRSLTIQTMTYTGQGGRSFEPRIPMPVDRVEKLIEQASQGAFQVADFQSHPSAHPLCYGVCTFLLGATGSPHPLARLLDRAILADMAQGGYLLQPTSQTEEAMKGAINRLWSEGLEPGLLRGLRDLLSAIYPTAEVLTVHERQRRAERHVKTIYVHAHMDEDTFETGRAARCPDQVVVDNQRMIGACAFNLFHRLPDPRFGEMP